MKQRVYRIFFTILLMTASQLSSATQVQYNLRVDGITCPFCVATSAKALKKIDGVNKVEANIEAGLIKVCADDKVKLTDKHLTQLFVDKGFTYRGMKKLEACEIL
ncbi:MAG: heavy-metal-associated domain-containing protein [Enterobacterales bacterium]|nr:heavy-metal-associated domain-containing protein [Enterobacterales bacterium]